MLNIRTAQMKVFEDAAWLRFEDEMMAHSKKFSPRLCEVIGDEQLRIAVCQVMERAGIYGFTFRGPIRLCIELMFLYGSGFDTDSQYPAIGEVLNASGDQMLRAEKIYEDVLDYQEKVSGPNNINVRQALEALSIFARMPVTLSTNNFVEGMLGEMNHIFPQKVAYVGEERLIELIHEGQAKARIYGFPTVRGEAMMVALMFAFGHGCTEDPLYPWISRTLQDERIKDSAARANRLEKKAVTWLDHVLARPREGAQG